MKLYFLFFGSARYLPLLNRLVTTFQLSGSELPWEVLTDAAGAALLPAGYPRYIVDPTPWNHLIRPGNPGEAFDRKSTYLLALMNEYFHHERFAVLDCDNVVHSDPMRELLDVPQNVMAMAECPHDPPIDAPFLSGVFPERTSALMVFPRDPRRHARLYEEYFKASIEPTHYLLEQRTWSLVWHATDGYLLPRTLSWSRFWGEPPSDVLVRHLHGEQKWLESSVVTE